MKQTMLALIVSAFALSFHLAQPAFAQNNFAQCVAACKKAGGGSSAMSLCIQRCKQMK